MAPCHCLTRHSHPTLNDLGMTDALGATNEGCSCERASRTRIGSSRVRVQRAAVLMSEKKRNGMAVAALSASRPENQATKCLVGLAASLFRLRFR